MPGRSSRFGDKNESLISKLGMLMGQVRHLHEALLGERRVAAMMIWRHQPADAQEGLRENKIILGNLEEERKTVEEGPWRKSIHLKSRT